ncbi:hypothetical protein [Mycolicibacterium setense]
MADCMICDLYKAIDRHGDTGSDFVADLVSVLPPRGHGMHNLAIWHEHYHSPAS